MKTTNHKVEVTENEVGVCYEYDEVFTEKLLLGSADLDGTEGLNLDEDRYEGTYAGPVTDEEVEEALVNGLPENCLLAPLRERYEKHVALTEETNDFWPEELQEAPMSFEEFFASTFRGFSVVRHEGKVRLHWEAVLS